ncbi:MAG: hypothetical protein P4L81_07950 [Candidatus Pacebacteria bacterium]|nr:hypothetical protein [Candidatus Paceibacterota bacterium]
MNCCTDHVSFDDVLNELRSIKPKRQGRHLCLMSKKGRLSYGSMTKSGGKSPAWYFICIDNGMLVFARRYSIRKIGYEMAKRMAEMNVLYTQSIYNGTQTSFFMIDFDNQGRVTEYNGKQTSFMI